MTFEKMRNMRKSYKNSHFLSKMAVWSEWGDSNARPREPKSRALPTALHPVIELFYPAGRILPKRARRQLRCTRRCPTPPIIAELRLSFKLFFGQPTFLEKQNFLSKACYRRAEM